MRSFGVTIYLMLFLIISLETRAQFGNQKAFGSIKFNSPLHEWDGFGVNYVESCQTLDYEKQPQDLGGFSILSQKEKSEINELIFGKDGLRPAIIKMFLDPWHLAGPDAKYKHRWSTENMRYFVRKGIEKANEQGDAIQIITTLYGPPAFMTKHNNPSISVLHPKYKKALAMYMIDWAKFLKNEEKFPLNYISIHNEGLDWLRWPQYKDQENAIQKGRDYNLLWRPNEIAEYMAFMKPLMLKEGLVDVGLTPGEAMNWFRFYHFGVADEIVTNQEALKSIDLITSHGFGLGNNFGRAYSSSYNEGADLIKKYRPDLKVWTTSLSWGKMNANFGAEIHEHIYSSKVNAIIPWAAIQRTSQWYMTNFHPSCAISVNEDGSYEVLKGYFLFKQFTRAGKAGMNIVRARINRPEVFITAFGQNKTKNPDAFVITNLGESNTFVTDRVSLSFQIENKKQQYTFPYRDLTLSHNQEGARNLDGVMFQALPTDKGYTMEFAFPWKTLNTQNAIPESFSYNVLVHDGRDMPHGKIGWLGENSSFNGTVRVGLKEENDENTITIAKTKQPLTIDALEDESWNPVKEYDVSNNLMNGTPPMISASWKMKYDDNYLYVLVSVIDPSNEMGRKLSLTIEGTPYTKFNAFRTDEKHENYEALGEFTLKEGVLEYLSPNHSITTFIGVK